MANEVGTPWGIVVRHPDFLELRWLSSSAGMADRGLMATVGLFAHEAEQRPPSGLLVDAREFPSRATEAMIAWRNAHIVPRYGAAGVQRFAVLMPPRFAGAGRETFEGPAIFPTRWFV